MTGNRLTILGIETSCDETAASVVRGCAPGPGEILSDIVFSQTEAHAPYGGVVPEIASRAHLVSGWPIWTASPPPPGRG